MKKSLRIMFGIISVVLLFFLTWTAAFTQPGGQMSPIRRSSLMMLPETQLMLTDWFIQSSARLQADGAALSRPGIMTDRWYPTQVPSTVLGTLVENNIYGDVFFGKNLEKIKAEDFQTSWWYRTEFLLPAYPGRTRTFLELDGVNYRANIWLNGQKVADASEIYGPFRRFRLDITGLARSGQRNVLAIEVIPPAKGEPTIGFVDWNPAPADNSMGLWRPVRIRQTGEVTIENPFVQTSLDTTTLKEARLTIQAEVRNHSEVPITGSLEVELENIRLSREVKLGSKEVQKVVFSPETNKELVLTNPRVWWTHDLGRPELNLLSMAFRLKVPSAEEKAAIKPPAAAEPAQPPVQEKEQEKPQDREKDKDRMRIPPQFRALQPVSDWLVLRFGIREIKDYINEQGHRGYLLNGKKILIRGGGWTDDLFLNNRSKKLRAELMYARHLNLNALRLEGFWGTSRELYHLCDELGLLLMVGWSCHWEWENYLGKPADPRYGGITSPEDMALVAASFRDQVRWLRNHPSIFVWALASDLVPKPELEKEYLKILAEDDPTRPFLNSTGTKVSEVSGKSGVKMNGPYDWVPPNYWFIDKKNGGAFGFNTETGPGPQVPVLESLKKMIPEEALWPQNEYWNFHCSRGMFKSLDRYNEAMRERLGWPENVAEYCDKAQFLNYEAMRGMFEAFVARRPLATGVIQWMYNSAWPKLWWQLYDYYLMPTGAFYGARKANTPVHLIYDHETREIIASNLSAVRAEKLNALVRVFDLGLKERFRQEFPLTLEADGKTVLTRLPDIPNLTGIYFLDLRIIGPKQTLEDHNFYVLSLEPDVLDFEKTLWYVTPVKKYADLKALNNLPESQVRYRWKLEGKDLIKNLTIELHNPGPNLAFNLEIQVIKKLRQKSVVPIFLEDNYLSLLPGERRTVKGYFFGEDLEGDELEVRIKGWKVKATEVKKF
ncbi:MAG: Beta-galactosidase/beta-glucuronidase [Candidatus Saccharicenans subterraneus]|uniref:Beta-galactosidase/beta-glucuronidase n=1 Tax=Candidatus Saccharicenans subterraneus TaxID=2508984 RepID=A0A3E2BKS0_9BACT|nr:MAG: Beta-galactosidase/beta-glucuronidase [Candidatus Saccharicenans subterraneum]